MARRVEIVIPNGCLDELQKILEDPRGCNLNSTSSVPGHITYTKTTGSDTIVQLTIPGQNAGEILKKLEKNGIGSGIGMVSLTSLDCLKPRFIRFPKLSSSTSKSIDRKPKKRRSIVDAAIDISKITMQGDKYRDFRKPPLTLDEVYGTIVVNAQMTASTWINIIGASVIAAGGSASNNIVYTVAAMLVSPIMGPVLGGTFAYHVADWKLFSYSLRNLLKMSVTAFITGFLFIVPTEIYNHTTKTVDHWSPQDDTITAFGDLTSLIFSALVAAATGVVLGNAILRQRTGDKSLIGIAISAGLLPPIVNSGMLMALSLLHKSLSGEPANVEYIIQSRNSAISFAIHSFCIFTGANILFFLKDLYPNFRKEDDDVMKEQTESHEQYLRDLENLGVMTDKDRKIKKTPWWTSIVPFFILSRARRASEGLVQDTGDSRDYSNGSDITSGNLSEGLLDGRDQSNVGDDFLSDSSEANSPSASRSAAKTLFPALNEDDSMV